MAKIFHARVDKPFDKHETVGVAVPLSERGFGAINNSAKHRGFVTLLAIEDDNGDVSDAAGNVVLLGKDRRGAAVDPFAIAEAAAKPAGKADREEKAGKTR